MKERYNRLFLYIGLSLLFVSFLIRYLGASQPVFWGVFGIAILLKLFFLVNIFRSKGFKAGLWLYFILAGVALILLSLLFKQSMPFLRNILFYGALVLKATGLILMILKKGR